MPKKETIYTWKGLLIRFIFLVVIPGFFVWLIPYMLDHDMINGRKWRNVLYPLMMALILGTAVNFFYVFYYLIMVIVTPKNDS